MLTPESLLPDDETITLIVGPKQTHFQVSKSVLCSKSKYFDRCLNGGYSETHQKEFVLRDTYCGIVEVVLTWMNTGLLQYKQGENPEALYEKLHAENNERVTAQRSVNHDKAMQLLKDSSVRVFTEAWCDSYADIMSQLTVDDDQWEASETHIDCGLSPYQWHDTPYQHEANRTGWQYDAAESWSWRSLIRIYLFSDFYDMDALGNAVIDAMEKRLLRQRYIPCASDICLIYDQTTQDSPLQRFIVNYLAATISWSQGVEGDECSDDFLAQCPHTFASA